MAESRRGAVSFIGHPTFQAFTENHNQDCGSPAKDTAISVRDHLSGTSMSASKRF